MNGFLWCLIVVVLTDISKTSTETRKETEVANVYVSKRNGTDIPSCGPVSNPCCTIAMGVSQAKENAIVYVNGAGSETMPYACKSSSLDLPGIHANKSLEIIGDQAKVYVKCQEGYDIRLNKSMSNNETVVRLSNFKFIKTSIQAEDVNIYIQDCIFSHGKQGVNVVQSTRPITMFFTGSLCVNTSSCLVVNVTGQVQPTSKISICLKDSNVMASRLIDNQPASAIHVTTTGKYTPGSITCDIALHNVTLEQNTLGMKGLIFIDLMNAITMLNFETVTLKGNKVDTYTISLITIKECVDNSMHIANTKVIGNCGGFCRVVSLDTKNQSVLTILNSSFEHFNVGTQSGVINLHSNSSSVHIDNSSFTNNNGEMGNGGCISVNSGTATVLMKDSSFTNNRGKDGGVLWISTEDYILTNITNCHFESNSAAGSGGVTSIQSKVVHMILTDLNITDSTAGDLGGSFKIGNATDLYSLSPPIIENATVQITNINVLRSSCNNSGGFLALYTERGLMSIHDTVTKDTKAAEGSVAYISAQQLGYAFELINTTFNFSGASGNDTAIYAYGIYNLTMDSVTLDVSYFTEGCSGLWFLAYFVPQKPFVEATFTINNFYYVRNSKENILYSGGMVVIYPIIPLSITMINSVFESRTPYFTGGLFFISRDVDVLIRNVTFRGCYAADKIASVVLSAYKANVIIDSCHFDGNVGGDGGAIKFLYYNNMYKDTEIAHGCLPNSYSSNRNSFLNDNVPHREWSYNASILIKNTTFTNNAAITGGALSLSGGNTTIIGCNFIDNFAKIEGGHIYTTDDSTSVRILDSKFIQTRSTMTTFDIHGHKTEYSLSNGLFIRSQSLGPLVVLNSLLESKTSKQTDMQTLVSVAKGNYINFGDNKKTNITCPRGSDIDIVNYTSLISTGDSSKPCKIALTLLQIHCKPCQLDTYSLQHGHSLGLNKVSSFQCLPCPFGAECQGKITAKPNFWGYVVRENPPQLNFTLCPVGYCNTKRRDNFIDYNSCQGNRAGTLCGRCKENYSETLLSPSCCHDDDCHDTWLWGVAIAMATLMALYLIHKPGIGQILKNQILWFKCCRKEENEQDESKDHASGYLKIVFYFYQVVNILLITNSYEKVIQSHVLHPVVGIFNFQFRFSSNGFLCPFPGLTAVTKQLLFSSQVFGVQFMIAVCYCCHCKLCRCRSKAPPNLGPYLGAAVETLLLGYAVFANTFLQLLRCTSLGQDSHLFIAGKVVCYQWWQYILMVFVGVVGFPFILTLAFGSHWLYKGTISVKEFLLGCVLPLPYLGYKLISCVCGPHRPNEEPPEWRASVTRVLYGPFRAPQENTYGAMYWESILISRRLVLIIIYAFVTDSLTKELLLVLACVVILVHHHTVQPFRDTAANNAETVSLFGLVVIATINTLKASFLSFGQEEKGPLQSLESVFDWVQIIIITALPILFLVAVLAAAISLAVRLILKAVELLKCKCMKSNDEIRRLLIPSPLEESDHLH